MGHMIKKILLVVISYDSYIIIFIYDHLCTLVTMNLYKFNAELQIRRVKKITQR